MSRVIGNEFTLLNKIGAGSFGTIYEGKRINSNEKVAIKLEDVKASVPQLNYESKLYTLFSGSVSVPRMHYFGKEEDDLAMVIDLLGYSLEDLFVLCGQQLSLKTVLMLANQMISAIQYIHEKSFIHIDIKPDNFVMGTGNTKNQVFIIDFGLSKKYRDVTSHEHCKYESGKSLTGTPRYASINALNGIRQTRRDDMESLGYVWLYLLRGSLPWMGINARNTEQKYAMICEAKSGTSPESLCEGFPREFVDYFKLVRSLKYDETPNYALYRQMFTNLFIEQGYVLDYRYDWLNNVGELIGPQEPREVPVFKKCYTIPVYTSEVRENSTRTPSRNTMLKKIDEESRRNIDYTSDIEPKTSDTPTLLDDDDDESPATDEAVFHNKNNISNTGHRKHFVGSENISSVKAALPVDTIPFKLQKGTAATWNTKNKYNKKPPFKLPVKQSFPRWMIPRGAYE